MNSKAVLISIHPEHVAKILSGEKRLEFRRQWAAQPIDVLVIYATSPVQKIIAITRIQNVFRGSKTHLWALAQEKGGGISRKQLFDYMDGKDEGVAIELDRLLKLKDGVHLRTVFGEDFKPPQSFRYLTPSELEKLIRLTEADKSEAPPLSRSDTKQERQYVLFPAAQ